MGHDCRQHGKGNYNHSKKKITTWIAFIISFVFLSQKAFSEEREFFKRKLSIILTGGYCSMSVGDINNYLKSLDNYLRETTNYEGGKIERLHYFPDLSIELRLDLSSRFAVDLGMGVMSKKGETHFDCTGISPPSTYYRSYYIKQEIKVSPLTIKGCYSIFSSSKAHLFLNFGLAYFFSKFSLLIYESRPIWPLPVTYSISSAGPGLIGGIGFEYNLANFLALVFEAQGRYSKVRGPEGNTYGTTEDGGGALYIGEKYYAADNRFRPYLITSPSKPSGGDFRNFREAVVDLSGLSLKLGLRIKLF
jgi:hypothetical protein